MNHEKLYKIDSKNRTREWSITVLNNTFTTHAGLVDGKMVEKTTVCKPKNIGRANETTAIQQASLEAQAKWIKKRDRELYVIFEDIGKPQLYIPSMLALDATKVGHRIKWGRALYVGQAKLNGVRCTTKYFGPGDIRLFSRKGKEYKVPHIQEQLEKLYYKFGDNNLSFDGELYIHNMELGDISGAVSGDKLQPLLEFRIFDLANPNMSFTHRNKMLKETDDLSWAPALTHVPIDIVSSMEDAKRMHDKFIRRGYEGLIIRDVEYEYQFGKRTPALFKYKEFQDDEFEIIDVEPDKDGDQAVLVYQTAAGIVFKARSRGTNDYREHQLAYPLEYIGRFGTVRFSNLLKSGVPEFPRGIHVRPKHE